MQFWKNLRRLISFLLCIVMISTMLPMGIFTVSAETTDGDYIYTVSNGEAIIIGYNSISGSVVIPSTLGGYPVTAIGEYAFESCWGLEGIIIPDSITIIGDYAFSYCGDLASVILGNSVITIGDSAFSDCWELKNITIPDSVITIDDYAFAYCSNLQSVTLGKSVATIGSGAFSSCDGLESITIPDSVITIGNSAFRNCYNLESIIIPDSVTTIGSYAFASCSNLENITVDNNNNYYSSFDGVLFNKDKTTLLSYPKGNKATSYTIPNSVTTIEDEAFSNCDNLNNIIIPDSVTTIADRALSYCDNLRSVTIFNGVITIGNSAFRNCYNLESIIIPDSVTTIGSYAFASCTNLDSVTLGKGVEIIGSSAFSNCDTLQNITIDNNNNYYSSIDGSLFDKDKTTLISYLASNTATSYTIPNSVVAIGDSAFSGCENLESITIPNSVVTIGRYAFENCSNLESVTILNSAINIGHGAFDGCSNLKSISKPADTDEFAGGCGTETDPYLIVTEEHLDNVRDYLYAHFKMIADIEFADSINWEPIGDDYKPFTGTFDGNGCKIKNLYIYTEYTGGSGVGLFGYIKEGTVKNLGLENGNITATEEEWSSLPGGGMGVGRDPTVYVGSIAGIVEKGTITNCYNTGNVSGLNPADPYTGGIVGDLYGGTISDCYNTGNITGEGWATGGIAGTASGTITNCYNVGNVSATSTYEFYVGGIIGSASGTVSNCYYLDNISVGVGNGTDTCTKCSCEEMQHQSTFVGFDFNEVWVINSNIKYKFPQLQNNPYIVELLSIEITVKPTKLTYIEGEPIDPTGMVVTAYYNNNTSKIVTDYAVSGSTANPGTSTITITYGGKTATFNVTVETKQLTSIAVTTKPTKFTYLEGESFDKTGMVVTAYYSNGTSEIITDYAVSGYDSNPGTYTITITHGGKTATFNVTVDAKRLTSIAVTTKPNKLTYFEGENFDATGLVVTAYYNNNSSEVINNYTISGYDSTIGKKDIAVTYNGRVYYFSVEVIPIEIKFIKVTTEPSKLTYVVGEDFDATGMVVTAYYNNGASEVITDYTISSDPFSVVGTYMITITYRDKTDILIATVIPVELISIKVTTKPNQLTYHEGEAFKTTGMVVTAYYNNGTSEVITDYTVSGYNSDSGTNSITVAYCGKTDSFELEVIPLTSIEVATKPTKLIYLEGDNLSTSGMVVVAYYSDGYSIKISGANIPYGFYTVSGYTSTPGTKTITVAYCGKTDSFEVEVSPITSITVGRPNKLTYLEGEDFDATGMEIYVYCANLQLPGDTVRNYYISTTDYTINGYTSTPGIKTITITCWGKTDSFEVEVLPLTSIEVTTKPTKLTYLEGEDFDATGMVVTAYYNNYIPVVITDYIVDGYDSESGTKNITVTFNGKTDSFKVDVSPEGLTSIAVAKKPSKRTYLEGESFDATDMVVVAYYSDGYFERITDYTVSGYTSKPGTKTITVKFNGKTDSFSVVVNDKVPSTKVYYSDIFYGYDASYLSNDVGLKMHYSDTHIIERIYNEYAASNQSFWTQFETALDASLPVFKLDFRQYAMLMSDTFGGTDYIYQKSLDSANLVFAQNIFKSYRGAVLSEDADTFGAAKKLYKRVESLLKVYDTFEKNYDVYEMTDYEVFYEMFEYVKGQGIFVFVGSANITKIEEVVLKDVKKYMDMFDKAATAAEVAQAILIAAMMEDVRMEIVDEVLAAAPTDSVIYDGMSRLKKQLSGGFVTYFAENYLKEVFLDTLVKGITKPIVDTIREEHGTYALCVDALSVASWVFFDRIFDIPDLGEMTTQKVLGDYVNGFHEILKSKCNAFNEQFTVDDISKFEALFDGYIAATNAALEESKKFQLPSNEEDLLIATVLWQNYDYDDYINDIIKEIENTPVSERKIKFFEEWDYNLGDKFRVASDTIEKNSIYMFNGDFLANMYISFIVYDDIFTIFADETTQISIKGDLNVYNPYNGYIYTDDGHYNLFITIPEGKTLRIGGNFTVGGAKALTYIRNYGTLICEKNVSFEENLGLYRPYEDSKIIVKGNLSIGDGIYVYYGTIEFAGTEQQEIYLPKAHNVEVTNPKGIKYLTDLRLYGEYNLNGNPLHSNGFYTILERAQYSKLDGSDFQEVIINSYYDFILDFNIKGNVYIANNITVNIPEEATVEIDGNITIGDDYASTARLINEGTLICTGNIHDDGYGRFSQSEDSRLIFKGKELSIAIGEGTIEFAGTEQQHIYGFTYFDNIEVTNPNGIKYHGQVRVSGKYNLNGNPLDVNVYNTFLHKGADLDDSEFQRVYLDDGYIVKNSINADIYVTCPDNGAFIEFTNSDNHNIIINGNLCVHNDYDYSSNRYPINIYISAETTVTINGSIMIDGEFGNTYVNNYGTLICEQNIAFKNNVKYIPSAESKLILKGDLNFGSNNYQHITSGIIEFAGTEKQEANLDSANIVEISNASNEGVVFTSKISVYELFDHKGNNFTLYNNGSGSTFVDYDGDGMLDNVDPYPTIDNHKHDYANQGACTICGAYRAKFSGASLTLEDNIAVNFKVDPKQFEGTEYSNPYVVFTFNGNQFTVTDYTIDSNGRYAFTFSDIAPRMMNDSVVATLYVIYNGEPVECQTRSYSVKEYCYNMLSRCNEGGVYANNEKFKALLVDLLNYGEAAQIYGNYNTDTLVTADLTETQKGWATDAKPNLSTVQSLTYKTIENPSVTWKAGGLLLEDAVTMRFKFATDSVDGLTVKFYTDSNPTGWTVDDSEFVETTGGYYVYFDGLKARQMRETVYITVYRGDTAVSNTVSYSIESYAYAKQNDSNENLTALLEAMMKYGDSADNYING